MLRVEVPEDKDKLEKQIKALKAQIKIDKNEKDRAIHLKALEELIKHLEDLHQAKT